MFPYALSPLWFVGLLENISVVGEHHPARVVKAVSQPGGVQSHVTIKKEQITPSKGDGFYVLQHLSILEVLPQISNRDFDAVLIKLKDQVVPAEVPLASGISEIPLADPMFLR